MTQSFWSHVLALRASSWHRGAICEISTDGTTVPACESLDYEESSYNHKKVKVKSCCNPLRLGTAIVLVSSGIDFVNTPRLYSDRATR